jgi:hypothetical protein
MAELLLTIGGLLVAGLAAVYSAVVDEGKSPAQKSVLVIIAVIGLGLGAIGAVFQKKDSDQAQQALTNLQNGVGNLDKVDRDIRNSSQDLTKLDLLGGANYYVVLGTYPNTVAGNNDYQRVLANITAFFPDAGKNGMIWKHAEPNGQYEMGFGRKLSPAAAEVYLRLAEYLAKDQHPVMHLER